LTVANTPKIVDLPDFDLAKLQCFDPAELRVDQPMGRFMLVLAAVFNDLKGAAYVLLMIGRSQPFEDRPLSHGAQLVGMGYQVARVLGGILYELMRAIAEDHKGAVDSAEFKHLVRGLPPKYRDAWNRIERIACEKSARARVNTADPLTMTLLRLRNDVAFHYSHKILAGAYKRFFADATAKYHDRAVLSDGTTMEATRFYFADAAMEAAAEDSTGRSMRDLHQTLGEVSGTVNVVLKSIVMAYIRKVATLRPYPVTK
jgi:hypothetical protein